MKLIYVDESGDTIPLSQGGSKFFVLTSCIIDEKDRQKIEMDFRSIKHEFYKDDDKEFKSNFVRYANPDITDYDSPLKLHSRERYDDLEASLAKFLKDIPVCLISIVIDKEFYWHKYPSQNPYDAAYMFLLERIQLELADKHSLGIVIIDPRDGRVEKHFIGDRLERLHHQMRFQKTPNIAYTSTPNIVERLLYSDSSNTVGIQIADLYCYPVFHIYEYNKSPKEYWRFYDITCPKLRSYNDKIEGYGLKIFSDKTKKDLPRRSDFDGRDAKASRPS
jgi:hypothetical protein